MYARSMEITELYLSHIFPTKTPQDRKLPPGLFYALLAQGVPLPEDLLRKGLEVMVGQSNSVSHRRDNSETRHGSD